MSDTGLVTLGVPGRTIPLRAKFLTRATVCYYIWGVPNESSPLVSCIMPTCDRRAFVPCAISYFLRQDYPDKELLIIDDGTEAIADLIPTDDQRIRYVRLDRRRSVGAKRNLACEQSRGSLIAHWDDDDWHAPHRLRYQVGELLKSKAFICGISDLLFLDTRDGKGWKYTYPAGQKAWLSGSSLLYTREFWMTHHFADISVGEDGQFVWSAAPERVLKLTDPTFHVGIIHGNNVSPKETGAAWWTEYSVDELRRVLGMDGAIYFGAGLSMELARISGGTDECGRGFTEAGDANMYTGMTAARAADLSLSEFVAFNDGHSFPWMRRWELPFALFACRLNNTSAVLNCTINPAGFYERIAPLFPHVLYRHWNPIQNGRFVLPEGLPDAAFDRVLCINTLEHLLESQRALLIQDLARKLKPGGLMVLTCDHYFDSFWERPAVLQLGVMRADRSEVFNGWNQVTPRQWVEMCGSNGLHRLDSLFPPTTELHPQSTTDLTVLDEQDGALYRNQHPYPHACIGGVFCKGPTPKITAAGRKIVLALLSWNTRDITLEAVKAYESEARMLQRLGHQPFICVCDNGSCDGAREALRDIQASLSVPSHFIINESNLGNSIARNQIIDYTLQAGADYVLFMDGDIEIVPFSSVAMLRHMENCGHRLGCIGADSNGQTPHRASASKSFFAIDPKRIEQTNVVAWTQYGMFRCAAFAEGVRFDPAPPFDGAGWGFEDNDLAFQMDIRGYLNQRCFGMTYLHRAARSSVRIMREQGHDPQALYNRRKNYVIEKWSRTPHINDGPLRDVRRVEMRL